MLPETSFSPGLAIPVRVVIVWAISLSSTVDRDVQMEPSLYRPGSERDIRGLLTQSPLIAALTTWLDVTCGNTPRIYPGYKYDNGIRRATSITFPRCKNLSSARHGMVWSVRT